MYMDSLSLSKQKQIEEFILEIDILHAQEINIEEESFSQCSDNCSLKKKPSKDYVFDVLCRSNLNSAPGTDGITSLLYKEHWDILGDPLHQVITAIAEGEKLTTSQRTSLMVFGTKSKKPLSIKPEDKRRISLLNSDFKLCTALEADMLKQMFTHTLSPFQLVAGKDRRIHHGINKARDCINAVSKSKSGCALVDLDFIAAFDFTVLVWVLKVMRAKGVCEEVLNRLTNIYDNYITIPVINNIPGKPLNVQGPWDGSPLELIRSCCFLTENCKESISTLCQLLVQ